MTAPTPLLGCGICVDTQVFQALPFYFYWSLLFALWSLVLGLPLSIMARIQGQKLPLNPLRYFLVALAFIAVSAPFTMGAIATPLLGLIPIWVYRLGKSVVQNSQGALGPPGRLLDWANRIQRLMFFVCIAIVPIAYLRLWLQTRQ